MNISLGAAVRALPEPPSIRRKAPEEWEKQRSGAYRKKKRVGPTREGEGRGRTGEGRPGGSQEGRWRRFGIP